MGLLNAVAAGLGGAATSLADSYGKRNVAIEEDRLMKERARLQLEGARTVAQLQEEFAIKGDARKREAGIKQGSDIDAAVERMQNERDAAAINAKEGSSMTAEDAAALRKNPEARKAYGLLNATRQSDLEDRGNASEKLGYLDAAKETRGMLQTEITNKRNTDIDASTNRRLDAAEAHNSVMEKYQMRREDRMDRLAESQVALQKTRGEKDDARSEQAAINGQRAATAEALKGVNSDIKSLEKEVADPMMSPEQKAVVNRQLERARGEALRYRSALAGAGLEGSEAKSPDKPFNPADFRSKPGDAQASGGKATTVANSVADGEPRRTKTKEQLAEEDARMAAMNKVSGGSARRSEALAGRAVDVAANFDAKIDAFKTGSKAEKMQALDWLAANEGSLSNEQLRQARIARRSAGM